MFCPPNLSAKCSNDLCKCCDNVHNVKRAHGNFLSRQYKYSTQFIARSLYLASNKEQRYIMAWHARSGQYQFVASFKSCLRCRNDEHVVVSSMSAFVVQLVHRLSISFALCTDAINTSSWITCAGTRRKPFCCWKELIQYWT